MTFLKPRFSDIIFSAIFIAALASGKQMLGLDSDLGRHLALGNYMLDERLIPTRDLLSHTRNGLSRPPYEWLAQILFALAHRLLGLDGVILLTSLVLALAFTLVYQNSLLRSESVLVASALTFTAAGASSIHWLPRPHVFTFLFLAIWIELLDRLVRGRYRKLYLFPLIIILWANLHGGFVFGILAWGAYFAGWVWETLRGRFDKQSGIRLVFVGISSLLASIITPDLWRNWEAVLNNRSVFILDRTVETMRPNLTDPSVLPYTVLLVITAILFVLGWKKLKAGHAFLLAGLGVISALMARNIPLFAIAAVPILAGIGADFLSRSLTWTRIEGRFAGFGAVRGQYFWSVTIALAAFAFFISFNMKEVQTIHRFDPSLFPVEAVNFIEANPQQGKMFNDFNWGGYLLYRLWPRHKVFLDSQSDFYGEGLMREYDQIMSTNGDWQHLLDRYQVDWIIVHSNSPLADDLVAIPDWTIIYEDDLAMIFIRK